MAKFNDGYENISVKLIDWKGNDLARAVSEFGKLGEFYEGNENVEYSPDNSHFQKVIDEIINGKTFAKYAFEGSNISFQINNISRICLAQLTREKGFFCSQSGDVRPLTQDLIIPKAIYKNNEWMARLNNIQKDLEKLYIDMCEDGITYMDARYLGLHCQTISLCYTANVIQWMNSCNSRTENNFADEINYIYRLMRNELVKAIDKLEDKLSKKLWLWLLERSDKKSFYKRDHTYNNDFTRFKTPKGFVFGESAHNDWRKSSWKLELEEIYYKNPELLLPGEEEMIERWIVTENEGEDLPTTYDKNAPFTAYSRIKTVDYYKE